MNQTMKRGLALLMAFVMCIGFLPMLQINASAAEAVTYRYDSTGKYIYNWGTRGEEATFLSPNAEEFYSDNNTSYDKLAAYAGGTGTADAPTSALYAALQSLMASAQTHVTSYEETKTLFQYTDCQGSGLTSTAISCFYSGASLGPAWDGGSTWNREHTWPNSKGEGNSENDIMMLRPTASNVNSSRGNKAYGESNGFYNPNSASNKALDLRGDVARTFLYVYVRWGQTTGVGEYTIWGSTGIIESLELMLAWIAVDPVDTWELGRNDAVEAITGTRNVFVDYPELAFLLFGENIPDNITTPSGEGNGKCDHNNFDTGVVTPATCTTRGYTLYTCQTAGCTYSYKANYVAMIAHNYVSGVCSACGATETTTPSAPTYATTVEVGKAYKLGLFSTNKNETYYFTGEMSGYYGATETDLTKSVDVYAEATTGGYYLYFMNGSSKQYINLVASGTHRNFTFGATATSVFTWDTAKSAFYTTVEGEICYMGTYGTYVTVGVLQTSKLTDSDYIARIYPSGTQSGGETPTPPAEPSKPTYITSAPEIGKAYKLGLYSTSKGSEYYFNGTMNGYYGATDTEYAQGVDVYAETTTGGYYLYFMNGSSKQYINLVASGTHRNFTFGATATSVFTWDAAKSAFYTTVEGEICYMGTYGDYVTMGVLQMSKWADTNYVARFYTVTTPSGGGTLPPATAETKLTIEFDGAKANRTEYTNDKQVWQQNGITVTNNKAASTNNVGDYAAPARFYKSSSVTISCTGMTKIEIKAVSSYVDAWLNVPAGATATKDGTLVTIVFDTPVDSLTYASLSAQARASQITVYAMQCAHANTTVEEAIPATCTTDGNTAKTRCLDCGLIADEGEVIPAYGHHYVNTVCKVCDTVGYTVYFVVPNGATAVTTMTYEATSDGIKLPEASEIEGYIFIGWTTEAVDNVPDEPEYLEAGDTFKATANSVLYALYSYEEGGGSTTVSGNASISFANKAQRTTFTTSKQVWEQNGITVTNDKAGSSSNVGDYANPARFYQGSKVTISHPGMTKIVINCNGSNVETKHVTPWQSVSGATATVSGKVVTITFSTPVDSFTYASLSKQARAHSITVYYTETTSSGGAIYYTTVIGEGACAHAETAVAEGKSASCLDAGYVDALVCSKCSATLALGHTLRALGHDMAQAEAQKPTCTAYGWEAYEYCTRCDLSTYVEIPAEGHSLISHAGRPASCTDGGWEAYETCSKCSYTTYTAISARGHYLIQYAGKAATCTEKGWEAYEACADCPYTTYKEIAAVAHTIVKHEGKDATCTEKGWNAYETCSKCDYTTYVEIAAKGHTWESHAAVDATCTTEGNVAYDACKNCGATSVTNVTIPKLAHTLKHVEAKAATADAEGNVEYWQCETCGGVWTDEACTKSSTLEDVVLPKAEPSDDPADPTEPTDPTDPTEPKPQKDGFFARIWKGIANFFKNLFGKKQK